MFLSFWGDFGRPTVDANYSVCVYTVLLCYESVNAAGLGQEDV